ncbi:MAG: DUF2799 domain-containing protein [Gammaproteobacteria bacterium]
MLRKFSYLAITLSLALTGCATKPEAVYVEEPVEPPEPKWNATTCQNTNWHELGLTQGQPGAKEIHINEVAEECIENGVNINTADYLRGLETQAKRYCTPAQGQFLGSQGQTYPKFCIPEVYSEFYFEWYRATQQYCHTQSTLLLSPEVCNEIRSS